MRFVSFMRKNRACIGLMANSDQIIDLAEVNRRYLKAGPPSCVADMQSFIENGSKALSVARKAARYVKRQNDQGLKRLRQVGVLHGLNRVKLLAPIPWPKKNVILLGVNYHEHIAEGARARSIEFKIPEAPVYFTKPATSVIGHQGKVVHHEATKRLDFEVELAVVMGKKGRDIAAEKVDEFIFGYTVLLDMTARDLQRRHGQWFKGKSLDTFCPMGPWILHKSALRNPHELRLICRVNGEVMQNGNTRDMIYNIPTTIAELSKGMTLEPGEIVSTGTPSGVGFARVPPLFLKPGDKVAAEVEGVGTLEVEIVPPR
jgi:2-keto-4-pentenoate hydratase/2-oxohepta-3-ene-1,7-dioic acid hydratase in catechol pathway